MANINGTSIYYEAKGEGFPIVLVSGGGLLDCRAWDRQFETFSERHKVIRYDIRGIGKSARPQEEFSHSDDLYALLKFLEIERAHIVGLSFGGGIAIDFALERPEMVDHLVLAATGPSSDAKGEANLQGLTALSALAKKEGIAKVTQLIFDSGIFISKENVAAQEKIRKIYLDNSDVFENSFPLIRLWQPASPPAGPRLAEIRARSLVLVAENDNPHYKAITENLAARIPNATTLVIPGATHLINLDKANEFDEAVVSFLEG